MVFDWLLGKKEEKTEKTNYRIILEKFPEGVLILDWKAKILYANKAMYELVKLNYKEEVIGTNAFKFIHPESRKDVINDIINIRKENQKSEIRAILTSKKEKKWVIAYGQNIDFEGKKAILVVLRDVTEKKEIQEDYERIFNHINDFIAETDLKGKILKINDSFEKILGYSKNEFIGKNVLSLSKIISKKSLFKIGKNINSLIQNKTIKPYEIEVINKKGNKLTGLVFSNIILKDDKPYRIQVIIRDVTLQKKIEKELIESKEKYFSLFKNTSNFITIVDDKFKIVDINRVVEGLDKNNVIGSSVFDFVEKKYHDELKRKINNVFKTKKSEELTSIASGPNNTKSWYYNTISPVIIKDKVILVNLTANDFTKQKKSEEELEKSEERFRKLSTISTDYIYEWDVKTDRLDWYGNFEKDLGYKKGEIPRNVKSWINLIHPEDRPDLKQAVELHKKSTKPICYNYRIRKKNGSYVYWEDRAAPIFDNKNKLIKWVGGCTDITERKKAEDEILDTKNFYQSILDKVVTGVWVSNEKDIIFYVNKEMSRIAGISIERIKNINVLKGFPKKTIENFKHYYLKAKKELKNIYYESVFIITPSGRETYQSGWLIPIIKNNKFNGMICTVQDITERIKSEKALKESEEKYKRIVQNQPYITITFDTKGGIIYANKYCEKLTGMKLKDFKGKRFDQLKLLSAKQLITAFNEFRKNLKGKITKKSIYEITLKNKEKKLIELMGIPIIKEGKVVEVLDIGREVTDEQKSQELLKKYNEKLKQEVKDRTKKLREQNKELKKLKLSLEKKVKLGTKELQNKMIQLERFTKIAVEREIKMIELKKKLKKR